MKRAAEGVLKIPRNRAFNERREETSRASMTIVVVDARS